MKKLLMITASLVCCLLLFNCDEPEPPSWEPWNEVVHRDTLSPGAHFVIQLEATTNWDTIYFTQEALHGSSEIFESSDSASYYKLFYHPEYTYTGTDTIEIELMREEGKWEDTIEYFTHFFYFTIVGN